MKTIYKKILSAVISVIVIYLEQVLLDLITQTQIYNPSSWVQGGLTFMYFALVIGMACTMILGIFLTFSNYWEPEFEEKEKTYTKEQMENAIAFGRNLGISYPEMNELHADIRRQEIKKFIANDFKF